MSADPTRPVPAEAAPGVPRPRAPGALVRLACAAYEGLLLSGALLLAGFVLVPLGQALNHDAASLQLYNRAWMLLLATLYFSWFWSHGGQTLPMKTWRLTLMRRDGRALTQAQGVVRMAVVVGLSLLSFGLNYAWVLVDPEGQAVHDRLLGMRLVRRTD